jgi:hypothetical protein
MGVCILFFKIAFTSASESTSSASLEGDGVRIGSDTDESESPVSDLKMMVLLGTVYMLEAVDARRL